MTQRSISVIDWLCFTMFLIGILIGRASQQERRDHSQMFIDQSLFFEFFSCPSSSLTLASIRKTPKTCFLGVRGARSARDGRGHQTGNKDH